MLAFQQEMAGVPRNANWTGPEVDCLISLWGEEKVLRIMEGKRRNTQAFIYIAAEMNKSGFNRTSVQVNAKLKALRQTYYRGRDALNKSGAGRDLVDTICPYFDDIDVFLGNKPLSIPSMLIRSTGK